MTALIPPEAEQVEAATTDLPALTGRLNPSPPMATTVSEPATSAFLRSVLRSPCPADLSSNPQAMQKSPTKPRLKFYYSVHAGFTGAST
jgi:hypothetical protein